MKKKILVIIMAAMMAATMVSIIGCTSYQESVDISQENDLFCNDTLRRLTNGTIGIPIIILYMQTTLK